MKTFSRNININNSTASVCLPEFRLVNVSYIQANDEPEWEFPLHTHDQGIEISVILKGKGLLYAGGIMHELAADDIIISNEGTLHAELSDHADPIEQISMLFDGVKFRNRSRNCIIEEDLSPVVKVDAIHVLRSMAFHIRHLSLTQSNIGVLQQIGRAFIETLCSCVSDDPREIIPQIDYCIIHNVLEYIDNHYAEKITLNSIANLFYVDPYYLAHRFKDVTGYSFKQFVINRRIGEAERLLLFDMMKIEDAARLVGYDTVQYFYTSFKKYAGCTPSEFRSKYSPIAK